LTILHKCVTRFSSDFLYYRTTLCVSAVLVVGRCRSLRLYVTLVYCNQSVKGIKVIGTDVYQSVTSYDFILTFHSNLWTYSVPFPRLIGNFGRKLQIFPSLCI